jgi:hypothetical protein
MLSEKSAPAHGLQTVTPSDSTVLEFRGLYVGGAGNVAIQSIRDTAATTLISVPAGTILPIAGVRVMSTNTTATNIVALI